ncbi:DMT family transporter [Caldimonas brevitalea]|uniref:Integral membrane protein n=1 Tax=Caldimonas brevitalea TaxID=413882 RepID=A0A0G3BRV6_9BURK|nr:DMT family transporter [Caldimonas brevitalea]AKJ32164.1 integral membrane protein [Caldimonas brevitalea]
MTSRPDDTLGPGIAAGLAAGALWGLVFVLPRAVDAYSGLEVSFGRYAAYAALSIGALAWGWRDIRVHLTPRRVGAALMLGWVGNSLYYLLVVRAVRWAGTALTGLIIGTLPLWLLCIGRPAGLRPARLVPGAVCTAAGLALMYWSTTAQDGAGPRFTAGVACATAALACWTAYAMLNARWLKREPSLPNAVWTHLLGVATLIGLLPLLAFNEAPAATPAMREAQAGLYAAVSLTMGLGASWLATWLWNIASRRLPTSLAGQLIVSETLFALAYGYLYEQRWPQPAEWAAATLFTLGVVWAVRSHR